MRDYEKEILAKYTSQVESYSDSDVTKMNGLIAEMLTSVKIPKKYKEAVSYFYMVLHIKEYENEQ